MTPAPALRLDAVVRDFGGVRALDGVTLDIAPGEVVGLLGHNGAGKTTLVRVAAGLLAASAGTVRTLGRDPVRDGVAVRALIGVLPTCSPLDLRLSALANLRFAGEVFGVDPDVLPRRVVRLLEEFDLADRAHERVEAFSAGMRQRLALARVLLHEPELLLLDEPSSALDPLAVRMVRELIGRLSRVQGRTVVLCTHDLAEAQQLCDRVIVLDRGRVVAAGAPAELTAGLAAGAVEVEVDPADVDAAAAVLERADGVRVEGARVEGARLRGSGIPRAALPRLVEELVAAGVRVYGVHPYEPSLEEVYVALYQGRPR
ncbi:MAG: ATP-binding cassette domain-containing protein [Streptosporangiales bacterium]|nr:ATP-binding cassette domain-containing protein [Streptosporangiales bacterium]